MATLNAQASRARGTVQRVLTKGPGGQEFDSRSRFLNEFPGGIRSAIEKNSGLMSRIDTWVNGEARVTLDHAMKAIVEAGIAVGEEALEDIKFDPNSRAWVVVEDPEDWLAFKEAIRKSRGRMNMPYPDYAERQQNKREREELARRPVDINNNSELAVFYGSKRAVDPEERYAAIKKMFEEAGFKVTAKRVSGRSSSSTPPHLFEVEDHPTILSFELHPGGGIHAAPYVRVKTTKGVVKIINKKSVPPYDKLDEKPWKYIEVSI